VPGEFLSDEQAAACWRFDGELSSVELERFFFLEADAARLSPLVAAHLNLHGRYTFTQPAHADLRPLRDLAAADQQ